MDPWNKDPLYEMFYVTVPQSQRVTNMIICYNTGIIVATRVMIVGSIFCRCDLTAISWVLDHLSLLCLFMSGWVSYAINNCGNKLVLFRVNFVCGDRSSCIGGFIFLSTPFIYRLFSIWIIHCTLLSIAAELRPLFFPIPPSRIAYVNTIFTLISISFASSSASPSTTLTASNWLPLPPLLPVLTWRLRPYLPNEVWVACKRLDITVDR